MHRHARRRCCRTVASLLGASLAMLGTSAGAADAAGWTTANQHQLVPHTSIRTGGRARAPGTGCATPSTVGGASTVVMNPNSGPGTAANSGLPARHRLLPRAGPARHQLRPHVLRRGAAAAVKADIDASYAFYPGIDGIFLDEMSNARLHPVLLPVPLRGDQGEARRSRRGRQPRRRRLHQLATRTPVADEVVVFEGPAANYQRWTAPPWTAAKPGQPARAHRLRSGHRERDAADLQSLQAPERRPGLRHR